MEIKIGNKKIGGGNKSFIIVELGINHNGNVGLAKKMIAVAKKAGVDAVKLQSFVTEDFVGDKNLTYTYKSQGKKVTESQFKLFKRNELNKEKQKELFRYADKLGIIIFSTPQDNSFKTLDYLCGREINMPAIKVPSDDLTNLPMLAYSARKQKPMIISTGMSTLEEIKDAVDIIKKQNNRKIVILKCTSLYPTPPEEANLLQIGTLKKIYKDCIIGYSDHTEGSTASVAAVILGAKVIEKHFTLDKNLPGPDHWFAADPKDLAFLVRQIREAEQMLGIAGFKLSAKELEMKRIARRSIMFVNSVRKGEKIKAEDLEIKRPGTGLSPKYLPLVIGRKARKDFKKGDIPSKADL